MITSKSDIQDKIQSNACGQEMVKRRLKQYEKEHSSKFKCIFDGCSFVTKYERNLKEHIKRKHNSIFMIEFLIKFQS